MYKVPEDIFREMDTLAAYLFAYRVQDFDAAFLLGYSHHDVICSGDLESGLFREPEEISFNCEPYPIPEVHRVENEIRVITGLPGATRESVRLTIEGNELIIDADCDSRYYHTVTTLPPVDPGSIRPTIKNGVLDVEFSIPTVSSDENCS